MQLEGRWRDLDYLLTRQGNVVGPGFEPGPEIREFLHDGCRCVLGQASGTSRPWVSRLGRVQGRWKSRRRPRHPLQAVNLAAAAAAARLTPLPSPALQRAGGGRGRAGL